jgi:hypothetical protein
LVSNGSTCAATPGHNRRSAEDAEHDEAMGEAFLQNFTKDITQACRYHFKNFAGALVDRLTGAAGTGSQGIQGREGGRVAALRLLSSVVDLPASASSLVVQNILTALAPHVRQLATLARPSSNPNSQGSSGAGRAGAGEESSLVRRQRMFIGLARRLLALDAACASAGIGGRGRIIFTADVESPDLGPTGPGPGAALAEAIGHVICPAESDNLGVIDLVGGEIGPAQREALLLLPLLLDAGGRASAAAAAAATRLARLLRDAGGARAPKAGLYKLNPVDP